MCTIDIWHISFNHSIQNLKDALSIDELLVANRFLKEHDKVSYIITHAYLRKILSHYFPNIKPNEWEFKKNAFGKPYVLTNLSEKIYFNLSRCSHSAYIIFTPFIMCGIDVEEIKPIDLTQDTLNLVLSKPEQKNFKASKSLDLFYTYWTLKEAHLKALGKGLYISPETITFDAYIFYEKPYFTFSTHNKHYWVYSLNNTILACAILNTKNIYKAPTFYDVMNFDF